MQALVLGLRVGLRIGGLLAGCRVLVVVFLYRILIGFLQLFSRMETN